MYLNGAHDLPSSVPSSGPGSLHEEPPPELPELPPLPNFLPMMQPAHHPAMPPMHMYPDNIRPAPLGGRRSPPPNRGGGRGGYSRSPSPPTYGNGNDRRGGGGYHRSPSPSERSERSSYSYDEGRYSPPYPPRHRRRHSRDDRSPDRYLNNPYDFECLSFEFRKSF